MNTPLADQGRSDFLAGKKDLSLYDDATNGADYRRGWQLARLSGEQTQTTPFTTGADLRQNAAPVSETATPTPTEASSPRIEPKGGGADTGGQLNLFG